MEPVLTDYENKEIHGVKRLLDEIKRRADEAIRCIDSDGLEKYNDAYSWLHSITSYYQSAVERLDFVLNSVEKRQNADPNTPRDPALESSTSARHEILKALVEIQNYINSAIFYASEKQFNIAITLLNKKASPEIFLIVDLMRKAERRKNHRKKN